jgi:hypothetical protein
MREGEVGTEIAPIIEAASEDACRARGCTAPATCQLARALTGAEQAALKLWVDEDVAQARKYFSLSAKYAAYRDYRVNPSGLGLHGIDIPPGEVRECIPPCVGWLAASVSAGRRPPYGILQLSDEWDGAESPSRTHTRFASSPALVGRRLTT